jgi:hypothetical protein
MTSDSEFNAAAQVTLEVQLLAIPSPQPFASLQVERKISGDGCNRYAKAA